MVSRELFGAAVVVFHCADFHAVRSGERKREGGRATAGEKRERGEECAGYGGASSKSAATKKVAHAVAQV